MSLFGFVTPRTTGPKPFAAILRSPHRPEIDHRLLELQQPVKHVHHWLTEELRVTGISYPTLTRYKKFRMASPESFDRTDELRRDLDALDVVVQRGRAAMVESGLLPRPGEVVKAIELRASLLERFPDLTARVQEEANEAMKRLTNAVLEVVTDEQRQEILRRYQAFEREAEERSKQ